MTEASVAPFHQNEGMSNSGGCYRMTKEDVRRARFRMKLTQDGLASALGVTRITIARWESGEKQSPSMLPLALRYLYSQRFLGDPDF